MAANDTDLGDADDLLLIDALAAGQSYRRAAQTTGISERTVARRMANPDFRTQVAQAKGERIARTAARLSALTEAAMGTLADTLHNGAPALRVRVALALPSLTLAFQEAADLAARLDALETRIAAMQPTRPRRVQ